MELPLVTAGCYEKPSRENDLAPETNIVPENGWLGD